jgi:hypothetical protein
LKLRALMILKRVELTEQWLKAGVKKRLKPNTGDTWAKLKYDRQIIAIAATRRVECIYSTDAHLHAVAAELKMRSLSLSALPLMPSKQLELLDTNVNEQQATPNPAAVRPDHGGSPQSKTGAEGKEASIQESD